MVPGPWSVVGTWSGMPVTAFKKLHVYRLAEELADRIWTLVRSWDLLARDTVGKQIIRSVDSIGANIAEGAGRGSFQDNRRFVRVARGLLNETMHWLRRAYKRNLMTKEEIAAVRPLIHELAPRLNAYLKSIGPAKVQTAIHLQRTTDHGQRTPGNRP